MYASRRQFLRGAAGGALGAATGFAFDLARFNAYAADTSGYKALVCVFFFGGMDSHDVLLPYDQASYNQYADIRQDLMQDYAGQPGGSSRARERLMPLAPSNASDFAGREFALPEQYAPIHALFESGDCSIVSNVGPLVAPLNREQFRARSVPRPPRLFSHNDQQSVWMASQPEGARFGFL
ncbi:MAG: hypothetical protein AAGC56_10855, partial [Pseudomonadota bacterium]